MADYGTAGGVQQLRDQWSLFDAQFQVKSLSVGFSLRITWVTPNTLSVLDWNGRVRILRKSDEWPQSWDDSEAEIVSDAVTVLPTENEIVQSTLSQGKIFYYTLFMQRTDGFWIEDKITNRQSAYPYDRWGNAEYMFGSLPKGWQIDDSLGTEDLYNFMLIFGALVDNQKTDTENLLTLFSAEEIHADLLWMIDSKLHWPTWGAIGAIQQRKETLRAVDNYKLFGTEPGYESLLQEASGWDAEVYEGWRYVMFTNGRFGCTTPNMAFYVNELIDGDKELAGVANWIPYNAAILTKSTVSPYRGLQSLRVAYGGANNPSARQNGFIVGRTYLVVGAMVSDGVSIPSDYTTGGQEIFTGTTSTDWQVYAVYLVANSTGIFHKATLTVPGYAEFDDCGIFEITDPLDLKQNPYDVATQILPNLGTPNDLVKYTNDSQGWHSVTGLAFDMVEVPGVSVELTPEILDRWHQLIEFSKASYVTYGILLPTSSVTIFITTGVSSDVGPTERAVRRAAIASWGNTTYSSGQDVLWQDLYAWCESQWPGYTANAAEAWEFSTTSQPALGDGVHSIAVASGNVAAFADSRIILQDAGPS